MRSSAAEAGPLHGVSGVSGVIRVGVGGAGLQGCWEPPPCPLHPKGLQNRNCQSSNRVILGPAAALPRNLLEMPTPGVLTEPVSLMPSTPRVPLKGDPSGAPLMPHF